MTLLKFDKLYSATFSTGDIPLVVSANSIKDLETLSKLIAPGFKLDRKHCRKTALKPRDK